MLTRRADPPSAAELRPPEQAPAPPDGTAPLPRGPNERAVGALGRDGKPQPPFVIPFWK
jgi:hypothetical protein